METDDLADVAERVGSPIEVGTVEWHDGKVGSWEMVGMAEAMAEPWVPFFIRYPRRATASPPVLSGREPDRIAWIEVAGDADRLHAWLGTAASSVRVTDGPPGIRSVGLETNRGEVVLR